MMRAGSPIEPRALGPPPEPGVPGVDPGRGGGGLGGIPRANAPLRFSPPARPLAGAALALGAGAKAQGGALNSQGQLPPPIGAGQDVDADLLPGPSAAQLLAQIRGENARRLLVPERPATRLDTAEVKRLEKAARRAASAASKSHAKAVALAQQLGRPLHDLTNDLPMGNGSFGGADSGIPLGPPDPLGLGGGRDSQGARQPQVDRLNTPTFGRDPAFVELGARSALDSMLQGGDGRLPMRNLESSFPGGQPLGRGGGDSFGGWLHGRQPLDPALGGREPDGRVDAGADAWHGAPAFPPLAPGSSETPGARLWDAARQAHVPAGGADGGRFQMGGPMGGFSWEPPRDRTPGGGGHDRDPPGGRDGFAPSGGFRPSGPFIFGGQGGSGFPPPSGGSGGCGGGSGASSHWAPPSTPSPPTLEDSPWLQAYYLLHPPWAGRLAPGKFLEVVTHDSAGTPDGTAIFYLEHVSAITLAHGAFCEACHCGSSNAQRSAEFDQAFLLDPLTRAALHLCPQGQGACQELLAGRPTLHVTQARIRDARGLLEPWFRSDARSTPAAGVPGGGAASAQERITDLKAKLSEAKRLNSPAARLALSAQLAQESESKKRKRKRKKRDASDGSSSESDSGTLFRAGARPEDRGSQGTMRDYSQAHPGRLYEQAMAGVASRLGERVGPGFVVNQPRMSAYLQSVICNKHQKIAVPILRELRTLAEAIDELSAGHVASTADLAMQRFKAIEHSLSHNGQWQLARALEVTRDEDTLVSVEEEVQAAKAVLKRAQLDAIEKKTAGARGGGQDR